jgi:translation initiation factor 1
MSETCPVCGLPKEICVCGSIAKEELNIQVTLDKKKYGKLVTVINGFNDNNIDLEDLLKVLKKKFACGGSLKNDEIVLQGNHIKQIRSVLIEQGFNSDSIKIKGR